MLTCYACIHTCIRSLFSDVIATPASPLRVRRLADRHALQRRQASGRMARVHAFAESTELARPGSKLQDSPQGSGRPTTLSRETEGLTKLQLQQELRYLGDPLKLADHTVGLLKQDELQKALDIVRLASRTTTCVVSWNHIINYDMTKGKVASALKTYNEVCLFSINPPSTSKPAALTLSNTDEKTRPTPRLLHLHPPPPRPSRPHRLPTSPLPCPLNLPLHVRR